MDSFRIRGDKYGYRRMYSSNILYSDTVCTISTYCLEGIKEKIMESISEKVALEVVAIKKSAHLYRKRVVEALIEDAISRRIIEDKQK